MADYVDVYLVPIPEANLEAYSKMAAAAGKVFRKHGAISYREYIASDMTAEGVVPFPDVIKLEPGETLIYAAVEFESEEHRNETMKKVMEDPELEAGMMEADKKLFDYKKMVYGGFKILVEV
jgi:uncharacterized protein YbaA (DUF1428 family)